MARRLRFARDLDALQRGRAALYRRAMRSWVAAAVLLACLHRPLRADEVRNTVTANPVRFALLHFQVDYERAVAGRLSLFVSPIVFHHATWYPFARAPHMTANGFGLDFGARWFLTGSAPAGAFVGPFLSAYRGEVLHDDDTVLEGYVYSPGIQAGYTMLLGHWALSGGGGGSYGFATEEAPDGSEKAEQLPHRGFWLNFRLNAGVAF
jgi:Protein of unknown function (DUF3575)